MQRSLLISKRKSLDKWAPCVVVDRDLGCFQKLEEQVRDIRVQLHPTL